ncbi:MAG: sugar phosphate nucleotidyltransferase [Myxococcales bacterium]|nr:SIS domain-containing protein [Myxococcales bacterium]
MVPAHERFGALAGAEGRAVRDPDVKAIVLVGGAGTRLPEVSATRPKPMADVGGRPFLEYLLAWLRASGVEEAVLCAGYKAEVIEAHFGDDPRVRVLRETEPLGTAGALRLALPFVGERALVLNGDSYAEPDLDELARVHRECGAAVTLVAVERPDASRFGRLRAGGTRLLAFEEKNPSPEPGLINGGIYLVERSVLERIPAGRAVSFEREVLPGLIASGAKVSVCRYDGYFEDIGVPEGLAAFRAAAGEIGMKRDIELVRSELAESIAVKNRWDDQLCSRIVELSQRIVESLRNGGKVVVFGNGGSAADAQHIAAELVGRYGRERAPLRAIALTTNTSALTAIANDYEYAQVFHRQVEAWVDEGDVVIGITTSGNSENVLRGLALARERRAVTAAFTGEGGGKAASACDLLIAIPSRSTPRIQESHITAAHILCGLVERAFVE